MMDYLLRRKYKLFLGDNSLPSERRKLIPEDNVTDINVRQTISSSLQEGAELHASLFETNGLAIEHVVDVIVDCLERGGKLLIFGNGGSAADAQHFAAEFVGRFLIKRGPLPAIALTTDTSALTAIGNDYGFDAIFSRQLSALGSRDDVAIALSTSGKSINVLKAVDVARALGMTTVGFTGSDGGRLAKLTDHLLAIPSLSTARIQECHIAIIHVICEAVDQQMKRSVD